MFELMFGGFWLLITAIVSGAFLFSGAMFDMGFVAIGLVLFFAIFWAVGIYMLSLGIKKVATNTATEKNGRETFGMVVNIRGTNCYVNDNEQLQADVLIIMPDGNVNKYSEVIGFDWDKYQIGDLLKVKHYKHDINIECRALLHEVPEPIIAKLGADKIIRNKSVNEKEKSFDDSCWNDENTFDWYGPKTTIYNGNTEQKVKKSRGKNTIVINGVEYERKR